MKRIAAPTERPGLHIAGVTKAMTYAPPLETGKPQCIAVLRLNVLIFLVMLC